MNPQHVFAVAIAALLLGACSGRQEPAAAGAVPDACNVLRGLDLGPLLGGPSYEFHSNMRIDGSASNASVSSCTAFTDGGNRLGLMVRISPAGDLSSQPDVIMQALRKEGIAIQNLDDLNTAAFWSAPQLHLFPDQRTYVIVTLEGIALNDFKPLVPALLDTVHPAHGA